MDAGGERGRDQEVAAGVADMRAGGAHEVEGAVQVDRERRVPDVRVAVDQRHLRADPGVGDGDVEAAERPHRLLDGGVDRVAVRHVALEPRRAAAGRGDLAEQLGLEPEQRDARAALVQPPGEPRADAARRARDEHAPAVHDRRPARRIRRGGGPVGTGSGSTRSELRVMASIS